MPTPTEQPTRLTRRGVIRTAAWSVPAVSLATAAPAFATSGVTGSIGITIWTGTINVVSDDVRINGIAIRNNTTANLPAMTWRVEITMDSSWGVSGAWSPGIGIAAQPSGYAPGQNPVILLLSAPALAKNATHEFAPGANDFRWEMPSLPGYVDGKVMTVTVKPASGYVNVTAGTDSDTIVTGSW